MVLTAYDTPTAEILDKAGVDFVLVGDSVGMVLLGYPSTRCVTMDEMIHHAKAVRRGVKNAKLIADLPLSGVEQGVSQALGSAKRFMEEAGVDAVKLEWGKRTPAILNTLVRHRIPVMGHVGLTPQTVNQKSGFKVRGRNAAEALAIFNQALLFEKGGAFSVVLECIPSRVSQIITNTLKIPTIGIGAGPFCDGQVLVFQDLVGLFTQFKPRHVKRYAHARAVFEKSVRSFLREVKSGRFPDARHGFDMSAEAFDQFRQRL